MKDWMTRILISLLERLIHTPHDRHHTVWCYYCLGYVVMYVTNLTTLVSILTYIYQTIMLYLKFHTMLYVKSIFNKAGNNKFIRRKKYWLASEIISHTSWSLYPHRSTEVITEQDQKNHNRNETKYSYYIWFTEFHPRWKAWGFLTDHD